MSSVNRDFSSPHPRPPSEGGEPERHENHVAPPSSVFLRSRQTFTLASALSESGEFGYDRKHPSDSEK